MKILQEMVVDFYFGCVVEYIIGDTVAYRRHYTIISLCFAKQTLLSIPVVK